jgi:hypothetical protein
MTANIVCSVVALDWHADQLNKRYKGLLWINVAILVSLLLAQHDGLIPGVLRPDTVY